MFSGGLNASFSARLLQMASSSTELAIWRKRFEILCQNWDLDRHGPKWVDVTFGFPLNKLKGTLNTHLGSWSLHSRWCTHDENNTRSATEEFTLQVWTYCLEGPLPCQTKSHCATVCLIMILYLLPCVVYLQRECTHGAF